MTDKPEIEKSRRTGARRPWVKFYPMQCLHGSIRYQLEANERCVWYDLIMFSALCAKPGVIADSDGRAYPHTFIANRLNVSLDLLDTTLKKCISEGRIQENSAGINIVNFKEYQSEYQRQKQYRQGEKPGKKIHQLCPTCGYKGFTDEEYCPECAKKGQGIKLEKDYKAGKYGHMLND